MSNSPRQLSFVAKEAKSKTLPLQGKASGAAGGELGEGVAAIKPLQQWVPRCGASLAKYLIIARLGRVDAVMRYDSALSGGTDTHYRLLIALVLVT